MHRPDASLHDPRPEYIRELLDQAGLSQHAAADRLGISRRMMQYYVAPPDAGYRPAPYSVQYALERLARSTTKPTKPGEHNESIR